MGAVKRFWREVNTICHNTDASQHIYTCTIILYFCYYRHDLERIAIRPVPFEIKQQEFAMTFDHGQGRTLSQKQGLCFVLKETPAKCPTKQLHRDWMYGKGIR